VEIFAEAGRLAPILSSAANPRSLLYHRSVRPVFAIAYKGSRRSLCSPLATAAAQRQGIDKYRLALPRRSRTCRRPLLPWASKGQRAGF